jgi:PEP-CTERM motif
MSIQSRVVVLLTAAVASAFAASDVLAADIVTVATDLGAQPTPWAIQYGHAFNDLDPIAPGLQLAGVPVALTPTDRFYDDYAFSIGGSNFSSITATIDLASVLDIANLQVRLYQGTLQTASTGTVGPALLAAWSGLNLVVSGSGTGDIQVISPISLAPGDYLLEVRGNVTGSAGGAYAGVMNLAPVPEPAGIPLAFAGLGALAILRRVRRKP